MDVPVWLYSLGFLPGLLFMRFFSLPSHPRFFSLRPFYLGRVLLISTNNDKAKQVRPPAYPLRCLVKNSVAIKSAQNRRYDVLFTGDTYRLFCSVWLCSKPCDFSYFRASALLFREARFRETISAISQIICGFHLA